MRVEVEVSVKELSKIFRMINKYVGKEVDLEHLLEELLKRGLSSSDFLFLVLSKLQELGTIKGKPGKIFIKSKVKKEVEKKIVENLVREIKRRKKIVVTPLEVAKFYQCPRRFYLEKVTMSKEFKEKRGRVWNGEALHLAVKLFIENLMKREVEDLILQIPRIAISRYKNRVTISEKSIGEFLLKLLKLIKDEKLVMFFTERTLFSLKHGLIGTPDVIAKKDDGSLIPIDVKLGKFEKKKGIKKEHLLQSVGEAFLIEDFFRKKVEFSYLIYFQSNSVVKIKISDEVKREFLFYKKKLEKVATDRKIPGKSKIPNAERRVCKGCHVKPICENIENLSKLKRRIRKSI